MNADKEKFIKKGIIFLLIFLILLLCLNYVYIVNVEHKKIIFRKEVEWDYFKKTIPNNTLNYGFFGDSHTREALNPTYINSSFNFSTSGEDYRETYYRLKRILETDKIHINNIIFQIDIHTFSDKIRSKSRLFEELYYYSRFVTLQDIAYLKEKNILSILLEANLPVIGNGVKLITHTISPPKPTPIYLGWVNDERDFTDKDMEYSALGRYKKHFYENPIMIEKDSFEYFLKVLNLAKENNIKIIFIKYPLSKQYAMQILKHNISKENFYETIFTEVDKILDNYDILDYYDNYFDDAEYFGDPDHLNTLGSEVFSKQVKKDLDNLN